MENEWNNIIVHMAQPFLATPSRFSSDNSKSKHSINIMKSRQIIAAFENVLVNDETETVSSINRQVNSGMILDFKTFAPDSNSLHHLIARQGDSSDDAFFSYLILEKEDDQPSKVIYKWVRKVPPSHTKSVALKEQEHIYTGGIRNNRKDGEGEYIVIRRWSDSTETNLRYFGNWSADIFSSGTFQNQRGEMKQINKAAFITLTSRRNVNEKVEKNLTIRMMKQEMKKKSAKQAKYQRDSNASCASILNRLKGDKGESSLNTIRL